MKDMTFVFDCVCKLFNRYSRGKLFNPKVRRWDNQHFSKV